jgi:hypothetical protein
MNVVSVPERSAASSVEEPPAVEFGSPRLVYVSATGARVTELPEEAGAPLGGGGTPLVVSDPKWLLRYLEDEMAEAKALCALPELSIGQVTLGVASL